MKKTLLTLAMALMMGAMSTVTVFAHGDNSSTETEEIVTLSEEKSDEDKSSDDKSSDEKSDDDKSSDEKSDDDKSGEESSSSSTVTATAEDFNITTNDDNTVTFLYADGTPMANVSITVKNTQTGEEGDISRDEFTTDENGVFDYSPFLDDDVAILRLTDPASSNTLEYTIETSELSIEAGKNKSDGGSGDTSTTNLYMIIGGAVAIVVIAVVAVIVILKQKKKKAAFAANAKKRVVKKK